MKKFFSLGISLMLFSFITSSLYASTPLVDAVWVKDQIGKEGGGDVRFKNACIL